MAKKKNNDVLFTINKDNMWKILTVVLAIALVWMYVSDDGSAPAPTPTGDQPSAPSPSAEVTADDDPVKGDPDAQVTIIEFSDFECPFCKRFYDNTLSQLEEEYIETGKAKLVYRDFPLSIHPDAQKAAEAAECAEDQGMFWEYHDMLFENQQALDTASLKSYANTLGLDTAEFDSCLDSGKHAQEVKDDFNDGRAAGVSGTPTFFINGQKIVGAQPIDAFRQIIDAELQ